MFTDVKDNPTAAFTDNKIGMFQPPDGSSHVDNILTQKVEGYKPDPSKEIRINAAVEAPALKTGTPELVDRVHEAGALLQEPGPVRAQSGVVEMGAKTAELGIQAGKEAFKMGGELIGRMFGGGQDPEKKMEEDRAEDQGTSLRVNPPVMAGPTSMSLG